MNFPDSILNFLAQKEVIIDCFFLVVGISLLLSIKIKAIIIKVTMGMFFIIIGLIWFILYYTGILV